MSLAISLQELLVLLAAVVLPLLVIVLLLRAFLPIIARSLRDNERPADRRQDYPEPECRTWRR